MGRSAWSLPNAPTLNLPPIASCRVGPVPINANASCQGIVMAADLNNGSLDPDGQAVTPTVLTPGPFPLGPANATLQISNAGGTETCTVAINVVDATGPVISASNTTINRCTSAAQVETIPVTVTDNCSPAASVTLNGQLTAIDGVLLPTPVAISGTTRQVTLPLGAATIRWTATDGLGLPATAVTQTVTVVEADTVAACCGTKTVVEGNALANFIALPLPFEYCAFGRGSFDTITGGLAPILLSGGDGNDLITGGSTNDVLLGRAGFDILRLPIGGGVIHGGAGDDVIDQSFGGSLYGGPGDDNIDGLFNTNIIYPGSGRDSVEGGTGDDTVIIYDACELQPFEVLDGGLGNDTLITPVSLAQLALSGVIVVGFNNIVVDTSNRYLSDCF